MPSALLGWYLHPVEAAMPLSLGVLPVVSYERAHGTVAPEPDRSLTSPPIHLSAQYPRPELPRLSSPYLPRLSSPQSQAYAGGGYNLAARRRMGRVLQSPQ